MLIWMALSLGLFILTSILVSYEMTAVIDLYIYNAISNWIQPIVTQIMIFLSFIGSATGITLICLSLLAMRPTRIKYGVPATITVVCSSLLNQLLKISFQRSRPDISQIVTASGYSFPSGHSMNNIALYTILFLLMFKYNKTGLSAILYILAALIGFSRIYLGVHYFSDVAAGLSLGLFVGLLSFFINNKISLEGL